MSLSPVLSLSPEFYSFFFHMPFETWQVHDYRIGYIYCAFALKVCLIMGGLYASCGGAGIAVDFDVSVVIQRIEIVNHERVIRRPIHQVPHPHFEYHSLLSPGK